MTRKTIYIPRDLGAYHHLARTSRHLTDNQRKRIFVRIATVESRKRRGLTKREGKR